MLDIGYCLSGIRWHPRHVVFGLPRMLRCYFRNDRKLLGDLCRLAKTSLEQFLRIELNLADGMVGLILGIQTFGVYLDWHPHLHILLADGLFTANGCFHVLPPGDLKKWEELFRGNVIQFLMDKGAS